MFIGQSKNAKKSHVIFWFKKDENDNPHFISWRLFSKYVPTQNNYFDRPFFLVTVGTEYKELSPVTPLQTGPYALPSGSLTRPKFLPRRLIMRGNPSLSTGNLLPLRFYSSSNDRKWHSQMHLVHSTTCGKIHVENIPLETQ